MRFGSIYDNGRWLVPLFLLIGVLAPTLCVLWFLNVAVNNQRDASRRKLSEAYRGQLALLRDRADSFWEKRAGELEAATRDATPAVAFARIVERRLADSAICIGADGSAAYPSAGITPVADTAHSGDWLAARSLEGWSDFRRAAAAYAAIAKSESDPDAAARAQQARIRCLMRAGDKAAAVSAIEENFLDGPIARGKDLNGRLIAADELLLGHETFAERLRAMLNDYREPLPSAQRLFLMGELKIAFPTYEAERLAAQFLESGRAQPGDAAMSPAGLAEVWKFTAAGGRVIALYRTATIVAAARELSNGLNLSFALTPPGADLPAAEEWTSAGPRLPGWQMSLAPAGGEVADEIARRQTASYIWVGCLAIVIVALAALAAAQAFQRHWRLARLKTDLVAAVSHELKTPVSSMRVLVDSLLDDDAPDAARTRDYLELIARENLRLSRLIENFLTFSRLERSRRHFEFVTVEPARIVELAIDAAQDRFPSIEVSVSPELPAIRADEDALVTVLLNLLDNAHKYTPAEKHIALRAFGESGRIVFTVEDNGIGVPPRERKKIFRRFYRVDRRLSRETGGCGLGLSIVEFIVKAHGGSVRVESNPGGGSRFCVLLPAASSVRGVAA